MKSTPADFWNSTLARCATVPLPEKAMFSEPGLALDAATTSVSDLKGEDSPTTITSGALATRPTGVRSLTESYGILL